MTDVPPQEAWTAADFAPGLPPPQSGAAHDTLWSSLQSAGARILNSVGYGAQDGWGSEPVGLPADAIAGLRKAGVFNDYQGGHVSFMKSANEALIRPAASFADVVLNRAIPTVAGAAVEGLRQTAAEIEGKQPNAVQGALAYPLKAGAELIGGAAEGAFAGEIGGFHEAAGATRATDAARARSVGVVGEGEAGFYGAEPLTPENATARASAAQDAGIEPSPPQPPAPDVHTLARRIDPETFEQFDALAVQRDEHRATIAALSEERENSPEAIRARGDIDTILGKVSGVEERLTQAARSRLADAQARLDIALRADAPEMTAARNGLLQADFAMRDLAPAVSEAYRHAAEIMPEPPEAAAPAVERPKPEGEAAPAQGPHSPQAAPEAEAQQAAAEPPPHPVAVVSSSEAAGMEPPSVTGAQKLGAGTKVAEEPQAKTTRLYSGGQTSELGRDGWFTSDRAYAEGHGDVSYVDLPNNHPILREFHEVADADKTPRGTFSGVLPAEIADKRRPLRGAAAESTQKPSTARYGNLRPVEGTGETATRGLSEGVEAKAIEDGLTSNFGDLPEYERVSMADQAAKAASLINTDYETAKAVAMGERQPPKGLLPESVFVGVEKRALAEGDVETLRRLATRSKLSAGATTMGQRIRTLGERDKASPVGAIQEVQSAREAELAKHTDVEIAKRAEVESIRAEVRKAASKPAAWADFISSIRCD